MPPLALARIEAGLVPVHDQDLELLLAAYGSTDAGLRQTTFCELCAGEVQPGMGFRVAERRQGLVELPEPPLIWVIIREKALFETAGGNERMRRQLLALRAACERPRVTVQIVPDQVPARARVPGPFAIVRLGVPDEPGTSFAYEAGHPATAPEDEQATLDRCNLQFDRLTVNAAKPDRTVGIIDRILGVAGPAGAG